MTNGEKYLKDGVEKENLAVELVHFLDREYQNERHCYTKIVPEYIVKFFEEQIKPTLSEDEKVILKVISESCSKIYRDLLGHIRLDYKSQHRDGLCGEEIRSFDNLFQFIKNGEEYEISDLLEE